jgi:hypothetical protein
VKLPPEPVRLRINYQTRAVGVFLSANDDIKKIADKPTAKSWRNTAAEYQQYTDSQPKDLISLKVNKLQTPNRLPRSLNKSVKRLNSRTPKS